MRGRNRSLCSAVIVMFGALFTVGSLTASAAVPTTMSVQGKLTDSLGNPLPPGDKGFVFRIFDTGSGGTKIWPEVGSEAQSISTDAAGLWTASVGAVNPLTEDVFDGNERWLEVEVNAVVLTTRMRLITAPYAQRVATVDGAAGGTISGNVGIGSTPSAPLHIAAGVPAIFLQDTGAAATQSGYLSFRNTTSTETGWLGFGDETNAHFSIVNARAGGDIAFNSFSGSVRLVTNGSERLTVNSAGNVGIGTTTPASKLDVRGDIRLGPSGQYRATSGEENLRIIRGRVSATGLQLGGTGFTVLRTGLGRYTVTFSEPFTTIPTVTATTVWDLNLSDIIAIEQVTSGTVSFAVNNQVVGDFVDTPFHFIAIGTR